MNNPLIFGKNTTQNIVSVEIEDNQAVIFSETSVGVTKTVVDQKYWILASQNYNNKFTRLQGNSHYKWLCEFDNREKYENARKFKWKQNYDLYSIYDPKEAFLVKNGYTYFKGMQVSDVSVLSFDIETNGFKKDRNSLIYTIANAYRKNGKIERKLFSIDDYGGNMADMLSDWMSFVLESNPSVILGHNIYGFDLPFLRHCIEKEGLSFDIGREGRSVVFNEKSSQFRKDGSQTYEYFNCKIYGREIVDTFFLSIKYDIGRKYDSYGLKSIIKQEGMEKEGRVFIDASKIPQLWEIPEERQRIKEYNIDDVDDALKLYDFMVPAFFYMTQNVPKSYQNIINSASGSQLNSMFVRGYLQDGKSVAKSTDAEQFRGGISIGIPGIYKNSLKLDLISAYPSTILAFNLFDKNKDPEELLVKFTRFFFDKRIEYKKLGKTNKYYKDLDACYKVLLNSLFGMCGATGLNYNCPQIASEITRRCREYLETAIMWATNKNFNHWDELFKEKTK